MNGIHDLGGMHGFGPIPRDDAVFHEEWERIVFALSMLLRFQEIHDLDEKRYTVEQLDPVDYLNLPYYGRWLMATQRLCEEKGVFEEGAVEKRLAELRDDEFDPPTRSDPDLATLARKGFESDRFSNVPDGPRPAYQSGDHVVVRNRHPKSHIRVPRYTRRAQGVVCECHGSFELPDAAVTGKEIIEPVYSVEFTHRELWGADHPETDTHRIDMWESYLKPAERAKR